MEMESHMATICGHQSTNIKKGPFRIFHCAPLKSQENLNLKIMQYTY